MVAGVGLDQTCWYVSTFNLLKDNKPLVHQSIRCGGIEAWKALLLYLQEAWPNEIKALMDEASIWSLWSVNVANISI